MADEIALLREANTGLTADLDRAYRTVATIAAASDEADTVRLAVATLLATSDGTAHLTRALTE